MLDPTSKIEHNCEHLINISCSLPFSIESLCNLISTTFISYGFKRVIISKLASENLELVNYMYAGLPKITTNERLFIDDSEITSKVLKNKKSIIVRRIVIQKTHKVWENEMGRHHLSEWIEAPLYYDNTYFGVIFLDKGEGQSLINNTDKVQIDKDLCVFNKLWYLISLAENQKFLKVVNTELRKLDEEIKQALEELLDNTIPDVNKIFEIIANKLVTVIDATGCDISLKEEEKYSIVAQSGKLVNIGQEVEINDELSNNSISVKAMRTLKPQYYIGDRSDDLFIRMITGLQDNESKDLLNSIKSWGAFPLILNGIGKGAIAVCSTDIDFFTEWRIEALKGFCEKAELILSVQYLTNYQKINLEEKQTAILDKSVKFNERAFQEGYGQMARATVHNLGNLILPVSTNIRLIENEIKKDSKLGSISEKLEKIKKANTSMAKIHKKYLTIKESTKIQDVNINLILEDTIEIWSGRASKLGVIFQSNFENTKLTIQGTISEFYQLFSNLINNGLQAMETSTRKRYTIRTYSTENNIFIILEDTGVGMPEEVLSKLIRSEPYTSKQDGTGIGVVYVNSIVEKYKGEIIFSSKEGAGTKIKIKLPIK